jgi:3-phosphoshikimate 1-carboxyvinyltransferase
VPLPRGLEILPLSLPVRASIVVPGSKSITNRALVLAALARGTTRLRGALWSEDTQVMADCLGRLGLEVRVEAEANEPSNRTITVVGLGGDLPRGGTPEAPLELPVRNAGTAARFLLAMLCLGKGSYRLEGVPRMHERPQAALIEALRSLGYRIEATGGKLPAVVHGAGARPGRVRVSVDESSQFASALLLSSERAGWQVDVVGADAAELPYVEMTRGLLGVFPQAGGEFAIEPDASSGSYFWGAGALLASAPATAGSRVEVQAWPTSGWQIDAELPRRLPLPPTLSRERDLGDSIMTAIVLAPFAQRPVRFTDLGRLRVQECERVAALRTELGKCGVVVEEDGDTLTVHPGPVHAAEIESYGDHRMVMCFATLGLVVPGIRLLDPSCVRKTFPDFFAKLAAPPPAGLGAVIVDLETRAPLPPEQLIAERGVKMADALRDPP